MSILVHWFLRCQCSVLHLLLKRIQFTLNHGLNVPVKVTQFCLPFQARILKWGAIPFFRGSFQSSDGTQVSHCSQILYQLSHQGNPTFQGPMQFCSLQHWTLLLPWDPSTTEFFFFFSFFGPVTAFFLALFLCSSQVAHWTATNLAGGVVHVPLSYVLMKQSFF